jgi:hypothetical protein
MILAGDIGGANNSSEIPNPAKRGEGSISPPKAPGDHMDSSLRSEFQATQSVG